MSFDCCGLYFPQHGPEICGFLEIEVAIKISMDLLEYEILAYCGVELVFGEYA